MYILAIETTGPVCSVAVIDENRNVSTKASMDKMNHLKDLIPMAQALLDEKGIKKKEISAVAASIGPGSFTGIRIGVSTARALAQALNIPAVAVPTLDSFKWRSDSTADYMVPIFNARRGQVYGGVFAADGEDVLKSGPYMLTDVLNALKARLDDDFSETNCGMPCTKNVKFYGDGVDAYGAELEEFSKIVNGVRIVYAEEEARYQTAEQIALAALDKFNAGETLEFGQLKPDYMRVTEAEQKLKDGSLARERAAKMAKFMSR